MSFSSPNIPAKTSSAGFAFFSLPLMLAAAVAQLFGGANLAHGQVDRIITYQLSNVTTAGGAQVTGSFTYDSTAGTVTTVAISTGADSSYGLAADTFSVVVGLTNYGTAQQLVAADATQSVTITLNLGAFLGTASQYTITQAPSPGGNSVINSGSSDAVNGSIVALDSGIFSNVNVCPVGQTSPSPCSQTLTLDFSVGMDTTFGAVNVVTQGAPNLDFTLSAATCAGLVQAGSTCSVNVTFAPLAPGQRMGAVQLMDNLGNLQATTLVSGIGLAPAMAFDPGLATSVGSGLVNPYSMAVDALGNVFIADSGNSRVVEVPYLGGGIYGTQIILPTTGLSPPFDVVLDGAGDVFIDDTNNDRLLELPYLGSGVYGSQITVASGITSFGSAVDSAGNIFIADYNLNQVVEIPAGGGAQITVASGLFHPQGVAVDAAGNVYIADVGYNRILKVTPDGTQTTVGTGLSGPMGVAVDVAGDVFISDSGHGRLVEVPSGGGPQTQISTGTYTLEVPGFPAVDSAGNVYISNFSSANGNYFVVKIQRSQPAPLNFAPTGLGSTSSPQSVTVQNSGNQPLIDGLAGPAITPTSFAQAVGSVTPPDCAPNFLLAPGASCNLSINFTPAGTGPIGGTAVFTDNALNVNGATQSITLSGTGLLAQVITFGAAPAVVAGGSGTVSATGGGSNIPVVFSSKSPAICTVSGTSVAGVSVGPCTIAADQAGNSTYAAATEVTQTFTIGQGSQTINFGAAPSVVVGGTGGVSASGGGSGNPVVFTTNSPAVCTVNGAAVSGVSAGPCTIAADQAGSTNYAAAAEVTQTFAIGQGSQTIVFGAAPTIAMGATGTVSATGGGSGNPVVFTSQSPSICTVNGTTVSGLNAGSCVIAADQSGNANYTAATEVTQNIVVNPAAQTISFAPIPYGVSPVTLSATGGGSGNPVTFRLVSGPGTLVGNILTIDAPGTVVVGADQLGNAEYTAAVEVTQSVTAVQAAQIITFPAIPNQLMVTSNSVLVSASTSSGLPIYLASTTPSVCSVSGTAVTLLSFGQCSIVASQPGNGYYSPAQVAQSFTVAEETIGTNTMFFGSGGGKGSIVIGLLPYPTAQTDFTATAPWTATASLFFVHIPGCVSVPLGCALSGNGPALLSFTIDPNPSQTSRLMTITLDGGQLLSIKQAGSNYIQANPVTPLVSSGLNNPTGVAVDSAGNVYFSDTGNLAVKEWNASTQQVSALVTSGLNNPNGVAVDGSGNVYIADAGNNAIEEWIASSQQLSPLVSGLSGPAGVAVDSAGNVYFTDSGNNAIKEWVSATAQVNTLVSGLNNPTGVAVDAAGNVYVADSNNKAVKEWIAATQAVNTLVASGLTNPTGVAVDGSGNVCITDSGNGAILEWNASTQNVTSLPSSGSTPTGVAVNGPGNVYFSGAGSVNEIPNAFVVTPSTFTEPANGAPVTLPAIIPSSLPLTGVFAPTVSDPTWLTITSTLKGAVSFTVAPDNYVARVGSVTVLGQQYTINQLGLLTAQTITFSALPSRALNSGSFAVTANATSGLAVTFSSQTTAVCTVSGSTVTLVSVGTCNILAYQGGNSKYAAAPSVIQGFQVTPATQTITFAALANRSYSAGPLTVKATASSGLAVSFNSQTTGVCTVSGSTVTMVSLGLCTIQATQAGSANYAAATPVVQSFTVTLGTQTITFAALSNRAFSAAPFTVNATASSSLAVGFNSQTPAICSVSGTSVTLVALGKCTIQATQAGSTVYAAATPVSQSFTVTIGTQTITFGKLSNLAFGSPSFTVSASASSGLTVSFKSLTTTVCTVSVTTVTLVAAGTCTIQASQAGNANYAAATSVSQGFTVTKASQTITFLPLANRLLTSGSFNVTATASSGLAVSFNSQTTKVCTVSGTTVKPLTKGTCTIQATQAGSTNYAAATSVNQSFTLQ